MSITQDYEKLRKKLGSDMYEAIDDYIREFGKTDEWRRETKKIQGMEDVKEWERLYKEIHNKCKPIFIEDVVMNKEEWEEFESWYKERTSTYIIKVWENKELRESGLSDILEVGIKDLRTAVKRAKEIYENNDYSSIEVQTGDEKKTMYFRDNKKEKYYYVEKNIKEKEDELDEPE